MKLHQRKGSLNELPINKIINVYQKSNNSLFLIGYMGTIVNDEGQAPSKEILTYLKRLAEDKKNSVFIISDFSPEKIDKSLHNIPNLIIVANTGLYIKKVGLNKDFIKTHNSGVVWKPAI
jgi:trehalose-6-phosphatase